MKNKKMLLVGLLGLVALSGCWRQPVSSEPPVSSEDPGTSQTSEDPGTSQTSEDPGTSTTSEPPTSEPDEPVEPVLAQGVKNFAANSAEDKEQILKGLEQYALNNFTGGIPYRDNSGYVLFNERVTLPTDTYVTGYGFGVAEATLNGPLTGEVARPSYYHSWQQTQPTSLAAHNNQGSVELDTQAMYSASYWSTRFNADKTGYEWYPQLAETDRPVALNADPVTGMATKWRVPVKLGANLKYNTLSPDLAPAWDGRVVELEDYLTPFKLMIEQKWTRATDMGTVASGFVGVADELAKDTGRDIANVAGIKLNEAEQALDFEFITPKTAFLAMYNLSSSLYSPFPLSFVDAIGGPLEFGKLNTGSVLSLGLYTLESVTVSKEMVWKKNPYYIEASRYTHPGQVITVLKDNAVAFEEFLLGKLDSAGVPSAKLQEFKNDSRARKTEGTANFKLQVNALEQEQWDEWFGPNGSKAKGSQWDLKPIMANQNFLRGVYFSIDRNTLAGRVGAKGAQTILADAYMINPEAGLSWRKSEVGKSVVEDLLPEVTGYSEELAGQFFVDAIDELVAEGKYTAGTPEDPTKITLSMEFFTNQQKEDEGDPLATQIAKVFNQFAKPKGFELAFEVLVAPGEDYNKTYEAMQSGEFDFAFGTIGGNPLDPLDFMDTMSSSVSWNLSWVHDTSVVNGGGIVFKDEIYSYDALQAASKGLTLVTDGEITPQATIEDFTITPNEGDTSKFRLQATGNYFVDPEGEFVITHNPENESYILIAFADPELTKYVAIYDVPMSAVTLVDGVWSVDVSDVPVPATAGYVGFFFEWAATYNGETSVSYIGGLFGTLADFGLTIPA